MQPRVEVTGTTNQQNKGSGKGKGKKHAGKKGKPNGVQPSNSERKLPVLLQQAREPQNEKGEISICATAACIVKKVHFMSGTKAVATRRRLAAETFSCLNMHAKRAASNIASLKEFFGYHATLTLFGELCVGPNGVARSIYGSLVDSGRKKVFARRSKK